MTAAQYSLDFARRTLVPSLGGSIAVGDFDGDGRPDIFVVRPGGTNRLLRNTGKGRFADVTAEAKLSASGDGVSATFADYDRSGHPSLFIAGLGGVRVFRNNGNGAFAETTQKTGIQLKSSELYTRATLFDIDNDGFLDLVVTGYTDFNAPPAKPEFVFPNDFRGVASHLYKNNRDGTFSEVTAASGLDSNPGRARSVTFADFDEDGKQDLLIFRDDKPPIFYLNLGEWQF